MGRHLSAVIPAKAGIRTFILLSVLFLQFPAHAADWKGVDDTVVGKVAAEHGRAARPFLELDGDAQLFAFLLAGAAGGFVCGYFFRDFISKKGGR